MPSNLVLSASTIDIFTALQFLSLLSGKQVTFKGLNPETLTADLRLFAESGTLVIRVDGLSFKRTSRKALVESSQKSWQDWLYEVEWRPRARFGRYEPPDYLPAAREISDRYR